MRQAIHRTLESYEGHRDAPLLMSLEISKLYSPKVMVVWKYKHSDKNMYNRRQ